MSARQFLISALWKGSYLPDRAGEMVDGFRAHVRREVLADAVALIEAARAADEAMYRDEPAQINRRVGMREAMAVLRREYEPAPQPSRRPYVRRPVVAGKDTHPGESAEPAPDLHGRVHTALSRLGALLPAHTVRLFTDRVVDAVTPLVAYRPVWDSSLPPGGFVCSVCGEPVESEPCPEHAPDFFQPGRTYTYGGDGYTAPEFIVTFRVEHITPHPDTGELTAMGWARRGYDGWQSWMEPERGFPEFTLRVEAGEVR